MLLRNNPDIMTPECKGGASSAPGAGAKAAVANLTTSASILLLAMNKTPFQTLTIANTYVQIGQASTAACQVIIISKTVWK